MRRTATWAIGLALAMLFLRPALATPTLSLRLQASGFTTQTISVGLGTIGFVGSFAGYTLNVGGYGDETGISFTVQVSKVTIPPAKPKLTISLTETELPAGIGSVVDFTSYTTATLHTASSVSFSTYYDTTDTAFGTQHLFSSASLTGPNLAGATGPFEDTLRISTPFSITKVASFTPVNNAFPTFSPQLYLNIPEPMSLAILGPGMVALGLLRARTRFTRPGR